MLTKLLEKYFPDSNITNFWKVPRNRALILLPLWIAFIVIIFMVFIIPYNNKTQKLKEYEENLANETLPEKTPDESTTLDSMWQDLLNNEYEYKYVVYKNEDIIEYEGVKAEGDISGTKTDALGTSEYYIQDNTVYNVINDEAIFYDSLDNINYDIYLNPENIYYNFQDITPTTTEDRLCYNFGRRLYEFN